MGSTRAPGKWQHATEPLHLTRARDSSTGNRTATMSMGVNGFQSATYICVMSSECPMSEHALCRSGTRRMHQREVVSPLSGACVLVFRQRRLGHAEQFPAPITLEKQDERKTIDAAHALGAVALRTWRCCLPVRPAAFPEVGTHFERMHCSRALEWTHDHCVPWHFRGSRVVWHSPRSAGGQSRSEYEQNTQHCRGFGRSRLRQCGHSQKNRQRSSGIVSTVTCPQRGQVSRAIASMT